MPQKKETILILVFFFSADYLYDINFMAFHVLNDEIIVLPGHLFELDGNPAEHVEYESSKGVEILARKRSPDGFVQVVHQNAGIANPDVVSHGKYVFPLVVELVLYVAYNLLDYVLHADYSAYAAVFIDCNGYVKVLPLEFPQKAVYVLAFRNEIRLPVDF